MTQYLQRRYIRLTEAMWQIFEFSTHEKFLPVEQLAVYLPGKQLVYFEEDVIAEKL